LYPRCKYDYRGVSPDILVANRSNQMIRGVSPDILVGRINGKYLHTIICSICFYGERAGESDSGKIP